MGIRTVEVEEVTCDACGKRQYSPNSYEIDGVSGTFSVTRAGGGFTVNVFSCETGARHIGEAVANAIKTEDEK